MGWSNRTWACPYYIGDQKAQIHCEAARGVTLSDRRLMYAYADRYCSSVDGWRRCTMARALNEKYEKDTAGE